MSDRRRLPPTRKAVTHRFQVGGEEGYITIGLYEEGGLGELFIRVAKEGTTVGGLLDGIGIITSLALQHGVPLEHITKKMRGMRFDPAGRTTNEDIPFASSILDYVFRWLDKQFNNGQLELESTGMICPDCGSPAYEEEACLKCTAQCGWTRCG